MGKNNIYQVFKESVTTVTHYYSLLVDETRSQRLVGSTNEWVLDNYYMISEQEKVMRSELKGIGKGRWRVSSGRVESLQRLLAGYLERCHYEVDKRLMFRYLRQVQVRQKDWLSYPEVYALLPIAKMLLIKALADLCREMEADGAQHYKPTDKSQADLEHLNQASQRNLKMMNIFNSLRRLTKLPIAELVDAVSFSERTLQGEKAGIYDQMYDKTKGDYRDMLVRLARRRKCDEYGLVREMVEQADREGVHVGKLLFPPKRWETRARLYVSIVAVCSVGLAVVMSWVLGMWATWTGVVAALVMVVPASQIVTDLFGRLLYGIHKPRGTFKIKFKDGIVPAEYATMVIMPTLLKSRERTEQLLDQLEVYYLSNINRGEGHVGGTAHGSAREQNIYYTLVGDAASYGEADAPWDDEVAEAGVAKVKQLNEKYGAEIFNFVYRKRAWSEGEQTWLGYERKRGAILHFNDLLLGTTTEEEKSKRFRAETISQWNSDGSDESRRIEFVITLDTDTELVLYSAQKLIGAMAHPLNRARLSSDGRRVEAGYGIMQPRVNVDVEVTNKSRYAQLFSGLGGLDVYTTASFELYQDIFDEGSFCGKGIYDLRVFQQVLRDAFPENLILSHDLIEGCHIRCGLINDVELFDDSPSNYIDDAKRHHRWTRGDWQITAWLGRYVKDAHGQRVKNRVNTIGKWKIFDNLRRSVLSLSIVVMIMLGYAAWANGENVSPTYLLVAALVVVACPIVIYVFGQVTKLPRFGRRYHYYATLMRGMKVVAYRSLVQFALLPQEAWMYTDAIVRSCYRMLVSHRDLLNWVPSDEAAKSTRGTVGDYCGRFWFNYVAAAIVAVLTVVGLSRGDAIVGSEAVWCVVATVLCIGLWCIAPLMMYRLGRKFPTAKRSLDAEERAEVQRVAADTWHFFDTMMTEENNYLMPDNYQVGREPLTDYKTSPTNIGYSLTAVVSAAELGLIDKATAVEKIGRIVSTVEQLEKWNGHLYNWYGVQSMKVLPNFFVSTCDSGNFVACMHVAAGYLERVEGEAATEARGIAARLRVLIDQTDFSKLYNAELDVFSIGYDRGMHSLLPYHYNNYASEARLTSFLSIAQGDVPYKHWFCLDKTLVQYHGYKGVASWYGTMFEYFMPLIFLPTYKHTLMDETYSFAIRAQRAFIRNSKAELGDKGEIPWGISETAYNELDDAQNYKYHAFGVPYLKFQNTTPDRIVVSPYSSVMAIDVDDRAVYDNMKLLKSMGMYDEYGYYESYDEEDAAVVAAHYAHHQGMILAALANYLCDGCLQRYFMQQPAMRSMETLLKEKAQVKPYIDLKVTQYKRYQYTKEQTESDAREFDTIAQVPEIGVVSNGQYTVLMNDRGSGFSRYKNILMCRYRKISADHYGIYVYVRDMRSDRLWSNTYAPLDVMPQSYHVSFASDKIKYLRTDGDIETCTEVTVLKDRSAELRRITFSNSGSEDTDLEVTSYGEVVLATAAEDEGHRVFNAMKIRSEYVAEHEALLFWRPGSNDTRHYMVHSLWVDTEGETAEAVEYETSRLNFLGRGNSLRHAAIIEGRRTLTRTVGTTLDPVMSMRRRIHVPAGGKVEVYMLNGFGKAREQLLQMTEQYRSAAEVENAFKMASVLTNIRASMSLLKGAEMQLYCYMAKYMAQTATLGNERQATLAKNSLSQSGLWRFGISGDLAILLMEIDKMEKSGFAKEMLRAFEYFKVHGLMLDLVFVNDVAAKDREGMAKFISNMAATEHLWATHSDAGRVYVIDGNDLSDAERTLLRTVARLSFNTTCGLTIEEQLRRLEAANQHYQDKEEYPILQPRREFRVWSDLEFYNQYGGFDREGRDYVVTNTTTPMPWVNVIANKGFGCVVSATMAGFTFARNAQQFKLTGWSNDIVRDNASEMLLIDKQQFVPATARHGQGWSAFDADYEGYSIKVRVFVAMERMEKYYQVMVCNHRETEMQVEIDMVYKLVMGMCEEQTARYLHSEWDEEGNSLLVRNVYHPIYSGCRLRLTASERLTDIDTDSPNRKRIGLRIDVAAGAEREVDFVMAVEEAGSEQPVPLIRTEEIYAEFDRVTAMWDERLGKIEVETPDKSFDYMVGRWYLYQVYASRLFARAGFYQVGGATGFRDQLQDVMSVLYSDPAYARRQILDHAAHQMAEGDVLHWWHESMHLGARTTFSDDYLWLIYVAHQYVKVTGDKTILQAVVPFCQAERLAEGEAERGMNYRLPKRMEDGSYAAGEEGFEYGTVYEHLRRAMNRAMSRVGSHGLPLMGCGDWNDGMSRVGVGGKGESVWVAFFQADLLPKMEELTQMMPGADLTYCQELATYRKRIVQALQEQAWEGDSSEGGKSHGWFLRAYYDNGKAMGSRNSTECQIDLISQAWSVLTDVATAAQKESVMRETDARLVNREHEIIQLLTPPFVNSNPSPGYIMNYPEGVRENGGQYTHGAMWYIMAQLKEGRTDMAYYLYSIINPIHRTQTLADVLKYKVEPYCIAADIYSNRQHPGRGGWTWYTGSASWAYKTGVENILGLHKEGERLTVSPCVPSEWGEFTMRYKHGGSTYTFHYSKESECSGTVTVDLVDDGKEHRIEIGGKK